MSIAVNIGANSTLPGIRGRLWRDGAFEYIPIPEREPTATRVPTYAELAVSVPEGLASVPVHLDPSFATHPEYDAYTYGDEHGVKAGPLSDLEAGDIVWFYASLEPVDEGPSWAPPRWGAFIIGAFTLEVDPIDPTADSVSPEIRRRMETNAHFNRVEPDAKVVVIGDPDASGLLEEPLPLSSTVGGVEANPYVTTLSSDSGRGPWWRRVLRFDASATATLLDAVESGWKQPPVDIDRGVG